MKDFAYCRPTSLAEARRALSAPGAMALAGGTTLVDLAKLGVLRPDLVVDLTALEGLSDIAVQDGRLRIGALARMSDVARHPEVRSRAPAISASLDLAASGQIRNMATIGGNILQRTRCAYYRDPLSYPACNKRVPGTGCAAQGGVTHAHAILGASDACIATYPGDLAVALAGLDAIVHTDRRDIAVLDLFPAPGTMAGETILAPDEIVLAVSLECCRAAERSSYLKIRDRQSYEFAAVSVALALDVDGPERDIRIAVGGVAARPWRLPEVEAALKAGPLDAGHIRAAAALAAAHARAGEDTHARATLLTRAVERALTSALEPRP